MSIGYKIKTLREDRKYSQEYVAAKLNITQSAYSKIESDKVLPDIEKLNLLADIYEISFSDLWDEKAVFNVSNNQVGIENGVVHHHNNGREELFQEQIAQLKAEVAHLREENKRLIDKLIGK
jgi:transcriptional regulator with XRE-family HTH domain